MTSAAQVLAVNLLDPKSVLTAVGLLGVVLIVFAETGLLIGFFLPGDTLLFTAGFAASGGLAGVHVSLLATLAGVTIAAILGAQTGYYLGRRLGPVLFERPDSRLFRRERVERAAYYFDKFGAGRAVVLARFIPIVRTFLNPVAGAVGMPQVAFTVWNVVGGVLWSVGVTLLGYWLGHRVPSIDKYLLPAVALVVLASLVSVSAEVWRNGRARASR